MTRIYFIIGIGGVILILLIIYFKPKLVGNMAAYDKGEGGLRYFLLSEFDSPAEFPSDNGKETYTATAGHHKGKVMLKYSGRDNMKQRALTAFDTARSYIESEWNAKNPTKRIVFEVNSGYRTPKHNEAVGGVTDSAHIEGEGGDINTAKYNAEQKMIILKAMYKAGFRRFGIGNNIIHGDTSTTNPSPAVWNYGGGGYELADFEIDDIKNLT